jgi:hypothetical protein
MGGIGRMNCGLRLILSKKTGDPIQKISKAKRAKDVTQVVKHLP